MSGVRSTRIPGGLRFLTLHHLYDPKEVRPVSSGAIPLVASSRGEVRLWTRGPTVTKLTPQQARDLAVTLIERADRVEREE